MEQEPTRKPTGELEEDEFYETMPQAFADYTFDEPTAEDYDDLEKQNQSLKDQRLTAIITIALTLVVAVAMGLLFLRGLDTIKSVTPSQSSTTTSN